MLTTVWHEFGDRLVQSTLPFFGAMALTPNGTTSHYILCSNGHFSLDLWGPLDFMLQF
jgi:hypothetical protein